MNTTTPKLTKELKEIKVNRALLHEVVNAELANKRQSNAHTKTKGEVAGSGKKPWRQKGTGRARVGSRRSPLWKGGGIVFGPTNETDYSKNITKKKKRLAVLQAIVQRISEKNLKVVDSIKLDEPKTKLANNFINSIFNDTNAKVLVLIDRFQPETERSFRNLKNVNIESWRNVSAYGILRHNKILFSKDAWENFMKNRGKV